MAGTLVSSVTETELSASFAAAYTTQTLNKKDLALPRGIVRGFRVVPDAAVVDRVNLVTDSMMADSTMTALGLVNNRLVGVTYRTTATVEIVLPGSARYYVAFVPDYSIGAATSGQWRAYTEGEFEGDDIEDDGGVFAFAVITTGGLVREVDVLFAGQSTTTAKLFVRETVDNFHSDQGPDEKSMLVDWLPTPDLNGIEFLAVGVTYTDAIVHDGTGSLSIDDQTSVTIEIDNEMLVWRRGAAPIDPQATLIVQFWFKTDASYAATTLPYLDVRFRDAAGATLTAKAEFASGRVPTYREIPNVANQDWIQLRYEVKIPDGAAYAIDAASMQLLLHADLDAGLLYIGRIQAIMIHRPESTPGAFAQRPQLGTNYTELFRVAIGLRDARFTLNSVGSSPGTLSIKPPVDDDNIVSFGVATAGVNYSRVILLGDGTDNSYLELDDSHLKTNSIRAFVGGSTPIIEVRSRTDGTARLDVNALRTTTLTPLTGTPFKITVNGPAAEANTVVEAGTLELRSSQNEEGVAGSPATNTLYESGICKGYGTVHIFDGVLNAETHGIDSAVVTTGASGYVTINLKHDMATTFYPVYTTSNDRGFVFVIRDTLVGSFRIYTYLVDDITQWVDPVNAGAADCIFFWIGEQA